MGELTLLWIIVLIAAIGIEAATMGLCSIWFAGGALAAIVVEKLGGGIQLQLIVCLLVSLALLYFTRPLAVKFFNKEREKTNLDELFGKKAVVTERIHNLKGTGQVVVSGKEWMARSSKEEEIFEEGQIVRVLQIQGVKLLVEADEFSGE